MLKWKRRRPGHYGAHYHADCKRRTAIVYKEASKQWGALIVGPRGGTLLEGRAAELEDAKLIVEQFAREERGES